MTQQEEVALELVNKFRRITDEKGLRLLKIEHAKQCALIAVDEILEESFSIFRICGEDKNEYCAMNVEYWDEVKQEINLL